MQVQPRPGSFRVGCFTQWYHYGDTEMNWHDARDYCYSMNATLAELDETNGEADEVIAHFQDGMILV